MWASSWAARFRRWAEGAENADDLEVHVALVDGGTEAARATGSAGELRVELECGPDLLSERSVGLDRLSLDSEDLGQAQWTGAHARSAMAGVVGNGEVANHLVADGQNRHAACHTRRWDGVILQPPKNAVDSAGQRAGSHDVARAARIGERKAWLPKFSWGI